MEVMCLKFILASTEGNYTREDEEADGWREGGTERRGGEEGWKGQERRRQSEIGEVGLLCELWGGSFKYFADTWEVPNYINTKNHKTNVLPLNGNKSPLML